MHRRRDTWRSWLGLHIQDSEQEAGSWDGAAMRRQLKWDLNEVSQGWVPEGEDVDRGGGRTPVSSVCYVNAVAPLGKDWGGPTSGSV